MNAATTLIGGGRIRKVGGWKPEPLERRDPKDRYFLPKPRAFAPEHDVDLTMIPVFDQLDVGDCVENALCLVAAFAAFLSGQVVVFSRLFGYAVARIFEGTSLSDDSGLYVPDAFKSWRKDGLCLEATWPYGHGHDRFMLEPSAEARAEAEKHQGLFFYRCPSMTAIKASLEQGFPLVFGTAVPTDLEDDGEFRMPGPGARFDSGHSMVIKGWNDRKVMKDGSIGAFKIRNSWGVSWKAEDCLPGEGWISYELFEKGYATDAITARGVEIPEESRP